jgi:hypothetical protein
LQLSLLILQLDVDLHFARLIDLVSDNITSVIVVFHGEFDVGLLFKLFLKSLHGCSLFTLGRLLTLLWFCTFLMLFFLLLLGHTLLLLIFNPLALSIDALSLLLQSS